MIRRHFLPVLFMFTAALLLAAAAAPEPPAASTYAPAAALTATFNEYNEELAEIFADEGEYSSADRGKVFKLSNTLAALAMVLANHDEKNDIGPRAGKIIVAAEQLSKNSDELDAAKQAYAHVTEAIESEPSDAAATWKQVGNLTALMEQVPSINSKLRRGVRRLERNQEEAAAQAAALAAIAQVSMYDHAAVVDEADLPKWFEYTAAMRDAAGETAAAIRALDEEKVELAMDKLNQSCDDCHDVFQ